ncbi:signal recognition particle-docking protein FtsY [Candidatus Woesearchaeota archaeon]|jgi:fused signal recognition particle receptor|nr:signal recognition particle-docking protein FtsY [Candidatus Woesearchaeota archaeon]
MFGKLKEAFAKFKKDVEEEEIPVETVTPEEPKVSLKERIAAKFHRDDKPKEKEEEPKEDKKGFFAKRSEDKIDQALEDFEDALIQNNVAYDITERILEEIKNELLKNKQKASAEIISEKLNEILTDVLTKPTQLDLLAEAKKKQPIVILFVGVNGVGKTTNLAKLAKFFQDQKKSVVFAAGDTFRAAAIEQLEAHAKKLKIKMIKHKYGADPAAVAYDAIEHAKAKGIDIVMIDTAGRQHASEDLMKELQKIKRVVSPDFTLLVVDALTGNDAVEQARYFSQMINIDGTIVAKTDADERGGAIISTGYETSKPILFLGTGQTYKDLEKFDPKKLLKKIL